MTRVIHVFRQPDRFIAGTVGSPGHRAFYLQASEDVRIVSVLLEKQQVAMLAERVGTLLDEVHREPTPPEVDENEVDNEPLTAPVEVAFRAGTVALAWEAESRLVVVELLAVTEGEIDESIVLGDAEEGPDALRVFLIPDQARAFAARAKRVVNAGRNP